MATENAPSPLTLSDFFAASDRRGDCWAKLSIEARVLGGCGRSAGQPTEALAAEAAPLVSEIVPLEEFWAYPGLRLMNVLREHVAGGDAVPSPGWRARSTRRWHPAPTAMTRPPGSRARRRRSRPPTSCRRRWLAPRSTGPTSRC